MENMGQISRCWCRVLKETQSVNMKRLHAASKRHCCHDILILEVSKNQHMLTEYQSCI